MPLMRSLGISATARASFYIYNTEDEVDLLVLNTKDDDQLAMHGLAYPLAIELREIPLLLL